MSTDKIKLVDANAFLEKTLGPWSSHPEMMVRQKRVLWWLGMTPFFVGILVVLVILTGYRASYFSSVHDWRSFLSACAIWWGKIKWSALVLALAGCVSAGFTLMLNLLWMVGMTLGNVWRKGEKISERDALPFPVWFVGLGVLVWLVPVGTCVMRHVLVAMDWRLNLAVQLASNFLCLFPMAVLLAWTKWTRRHQEPGQNEVIRHPLSHLLVALVLFVVCVVVFVSPKPAFFDRLVSEVFPWLAQCGVDADRAYGWVRIFLSMILGIGGAFHFIVWRLRAEIRPKKKRREHEGSDVAGTSDDGERRDPNVIPAGARQLLASLPAGVTAEASGPHGELVWRRKVVGRSPFLPGGGEEYGLGYLLGGDMVPTEDQVSFFRRFVESFDEARKEFGERSDFKENPNGEDSKRADILLTGEDGTGRTEILLAAALYATIVRGQRVLFLCADSEGAAKLADRATKRLEWLGVDVYVSADMLRMNDLDRWIDPMVGDMPPDLVFSTPVTIENLFFANPSTRKREIATEMRALLTGFGAVFVDDILEMTPSFRAHTAFLLDKMKLLQAAEPVLAQYVVASTPLQKPNGVEAFGKRLFGVSGFDRKNNVFELRPRPCEDYWFGTLRVSRCEEGTEVRGLDEAIKDLIRISSEGGFRTLLYQKGMSADVKADLLEDFGGNDSRGVSVASRYRELEELEESPDNVFYLSLACGDAGTALRLNLDGGDPVFFRIALEGEDESDPPQQYGLMPDETALALRLHHLRNVLQFVDDHVPVPDEAWARFQIKMNHPCIRELTSETSPGTVAVSWLHDDMVGDDAYGADALWPYLVLETPISYGAGMDVDFNVLPDNRGSIWKDAKGGGRLLLANAKDPEGEERSRHLALWRLGSQTLGESDLSHSDELIYVGTDEFTIFDAFPVQGDETKRYALQFEGQYRHGGDSEGIHPVRLLSWKIPLGGLIVPSVPVSDEMACFSVERKTSSTCRVNGMFCGYINLRGKVTGIDALEYSYDAYLSCIVLLPTFTTSGDSKKSQAQACLDGMWETKSSCGYSPALTHAFAAALHRKVADWPFFAIAPVFLTEGRDGSVGGVTIWIIEPANSGRTIQPLLRRLMKESSDFRLSIYDEAKKVLEKCETLSELRLASRLAFSEEELVQADRLKALDLLEILLDHEHSEEWMARRLREREEDLKRRKDRKAVSRASVVYTEEEREFDNVVVNALKRFDETIDVSKFAVEYGWDYDKISDLYDDILWNHPEVFWVSKCGRHQWWIGVDKKITRYIIKDVPYAFEKDEYTRRQAEFDTAVVKALEKASAATDEVTKALRLHDYIIENCEYDVVARDSHDQSPLARTAYSALVRRKAVCEGYAMAYRYLLSRVGIASEEVLSDAMNHCWNYVRLGENWYHVDVTWDDPVSRGGKPTGIVSRENFLLSDAAIRVKEHYDWDVRGLPPASDTTYDNHDWTSAPTKRKSEDGVPWEQYRNHPLLRAKGGGNVQRCRGKIHIRVFFVDDAKASWNDETRKAYRVVVNDAIDTLQRESGLGAGLEMSWSGENLKMAGSFDDNLDAHNFVPTLLGVSNKLGVTKYQNDLRKSQRCDDAPLVFVWNWGFRDSAHQVASQSIARRSGEWVTIGVDDLANDPAWEKHTFIHELLHLFGAADYYFPDVIETAAKKWLPDSVMNSGRGMAIDDLTRVLIGWDSTLTESAEQFLKATSSITIEEIEKARATS